MSDSLNSVFDKISNLIKNHIKNNYFLVVLGIVTFLFFDAIYPNPHKWNFIQYLHPEKLILKNKYTNETDEIYSIFFFILEILLASAAIVKFLSIINIERILETTPIISDIWYFFKWCNYENRVLLQNYSQNEVTRAIDYMLLKNHYLKSKTREMAKDFIKDAFREAKKIINANEPITQKDIDMVFNMSLFIPDGDKKMYNKQLYKVNFVIYKYLEVQNNGGWGKHIFKTILSFGSFFVAGGLLWSQARYFNNLPLYSWSGTYQNFFYIAEFFVIPWLAKKIFKFIKNTNEKDKTKSA